MAENRLLLLALVVWNIVVFFIYGLDKFKAKTNAWRISEKVLLGSAFLLGGVGAYGGMKVFRHKTNHQKFKVLLPITALITVGATLYILQ